MRCVIVGNGAAGVTAAETLRQQDDGAEIVVISAESYPMYSRPGLAYVILNEVPFKQIQCRTPGWYATQRIQLIFGRAVRLTPAAHTLQLDSGQTISYDRLLIATGARAVPPPYPGADLPGVVYLDTYDGVQELLRRARRARRAVVIGGGITALEMAEGLAHQHVETHYFLRRDRLWERVFNTSESHILEQRLREHGVQVHFNTEIQTILANRRGQVGAVKLADGKEFACDLLGVGIGVIPQLELIQDAGIATDRAILVNEYLETNQPHIFAAGDCAQVYDRWTRRHTSDVLWPSAVAQGRFAAWNMLDQRRPYIKSTPFNACLLFGLHITAIGQVNPQGEKGATAAVEHILSRGSSEVWFTFPRNYQSAWSEEGANTIRLTLDDRRLVGALIIGDQSLADPLRTLIEQEADLTPIWPYVNKDYATLKHHLGQWWRESRS